MRLTLFFAIVFSALALVFACSAPAPSLESDNTKDDGGKKKPDGAKPSGSSPTGPENDDALPPPTPPPSKDSGGIGDGGPIDAGATNVPTPFLMLDVRYPVEADRYITQCTPDAKSQLVWTTTAQGPDEYSRFANASYRENPGVHYPCGSLEKGQYPIVFSWLPPDGVPNGTWIARCVGNRAAHVYRVLATHAGHPAATYQYVESYAACP